MPHARRRLEQMELVLPEPPAPAGAYRRAVQAAGLIFVSGQLPIGGGRLICQGAIGDGGLSVEAGREAARQCALNALGVFAAEGCDLDRIRIVRMTGYVASAAGFVGQAQVVDGASEFMASVLGEAGVHARVAVGVGALPLGAPVELEVIAAES